MLIKNWKSLWLHDVDKKYLPDRIHLSPEFIVKLGLVKPFSQSIHQLQIIDNIIDRPPFANVIIEAFHPIFPKKRPSMSATDKFCLLKGTV
jgi:hypothetical protein